MVDFNTHYSPFEAVRTEVWCHRRICLLTSPEIGVAVKSQAKRCFGRTFGRRIRILMGGKVARPLVWERGRARKSCGMHVGGLGGGGTPKEKRVGIATVDHQHAVRDLVSKSDMQPGSQHAVCDLVSTPDMRAGSEHAVRDRVSMPVMKTVNGHPGGSAVDCQQAVLDRVSMPVMMAVSQYAVRDCVSKPGMKIVNGHPPAVAIVPVSGTGQGGGRRIESEHNGVGGRGENPRVRRVFLEIIRHHYKSLDCSGANFLGNQPTRKCKTDTDCFPTKSHGPDEAVQHFQARFLGHFRSHGV
jgi:hypothetical protein